MRSGRCCRRCGASTCSHCPIRAGSTYTRARARRVDVYASVREGSLTRSRPPRATTRRALRRRAPGLRIAHNGGESARSVRLTVALGLPVYRLPSTSPATRWVRAQAPVTGGVRAPWAYLTWILRAGSYPRSLERRPLARACAAVARPRHRRAADDPSSRTACATCTWAHRGGATRIVAPQAIELRVRVAHARLAAGGRRRIRFGHAVQLGLGAGTLTRFACSGCAWARTTAVEINPCGGCRAGSGFACRTTTRGSPSSSPMPVAGSPARRAASVHALQVDLYDHEAAAPVLDDEVLPRLPHCAGAGRGPDVGQPVRSRGELRDERAPHRAFGAEQVWNLRPTREGNTVVIAARASRCPAVKNSPPVPITSKPGSGCPCASGCA